MAELSDVDELQLKQELKHFASTHKDIVKNVLSLLDDGEHKQFDTDSDDDEAKYDNECISAMSSVQLALDVF